MTEEHILHTARLLSKVRYEWIGVKWKNTIRIEWCRPRGKKMNQFIAHTVLSPAVDPRLYRCMGYADWRCKVCMSVCLFGSAIAWRLRVCVGSDSETVNWTSFVWLRNQNNKIVTTNSTWVNRIVLREHLTVVRAVCLFVYDDVCANCDMPHSSAAISISQQQQQITQFLFGAIKMIEISDSNARQVVCVYFVCIRFAQPVLWLWHVFQLIQS